MEKMHIPLVCISLLGFCRLASVKLKGIFLWLMLEEQLKIQKCFSLCISCKILS